MINLFYLKNRRGFLLILCYIVVISFLILGAAFLLRSANEKNIAQRERNWLQAFHLAQAGVMRAVHELRQNYSWSGTPAGGDPSLTLGTYRVSVTPVGAKRQVQATGFVPNSTSASVQRTMEVFVEKKAMPGNFFSNALYVSGETALNGNAYEVNGDIIYADTLKGDTSNVTGNVTQDPTISPLLRLDFVELRQISQSQGNVYDAVRLKTDPLPTSFWFDQPTNTVPNVVYVEADLTLNGNIGTIGGFFVVVGDVITDPSRTEDTTINGNGQIEGCIYTTGEFTINGGGGGLNVNGGVWAGLEATLNGNTNVTYNPTYMAALNNLDFNTDVQIISWRETF